MEPNVEYPVKPALIKGALCRCPKCGQGKLFNGYLQQVNACETCGEDYSRIRAADGPAFFAMSISGLLLIPLMWVSFLYFRENVWASLGVTLSVITIFTLAILRPIKGMFIAMQWANGNYNAQDID